MSQPERTRPESGPQHGPPAASEARPWLWGAALCLAVYGLPLFVPPDAVSAVPTPEAGALERWFPGVPAAWVATRLATLGIAAALVARAATAPSTPAPPASATAAPALHPWSVGLALALAALHALAGGAAEQLGRPLQTAYVLALALPPLVLWLGTARSAPLASSRVGLGVAAVVAVWLALRAPVAAVSMRPASPVDTWLAFEWLTAAAYDGRNLLTEGFLPGKNCLNMFFQGIPLLGPGGRTPDLRWLQTLHLFWMGVAALAVGGVAGAWFGSRTAPVAAAAFLFSPFALLVPMNPSDLVVGPVLAAALLWLGQHAGEQQRPAALAGLGVVSGVAVLNPALAPLTVAVAGWVGLGWIRGPRPAVAVVVVALLGFAAAVIPGLPDPGAVSRMLEDYAGTRGQWAGLESVILGQTSPFRVPELWNAGVRGALDIPVATLLAPFAIPRTPIRLWGDALFDPLGAGLAAVGIGLALRHAGRDRRGLALLGFLLAAAAPALVSSYDRPSLTRLMGTPAPMALLAALGFHGWTRIAGRRTTAVTAAVCLAIAVGGSLLFDRVNPRVLAASWQEIALESVADEPRPGSVRMLTHGGDADLGWLHTERILLQVGRRPLRLRRFDAPRGARALAEPAPETLLWSPALESDAGVGAAICARWPGATLYTLWDRAGLSRAFAARPAGDGWAPGIEPSRWESRTCDSPPDARVPSV